MELRDQPWPSRFLVAGVCLLVPLLILPASLSFNFDSLPKAVYLYLSAAVFLLLPRAFPRCVGELLATSAGRLFLLFALIEAISLIVSSSFSLDPALSFFGARWRQFGALSQIAVLALGVAAAGCFSVSRAALFFALRMFSLSGLLAAVYALCQFFRLDPLLDPALYAYTLGTSVYVTRPPSSLGHPGYLAALAIPGSLLAIVLLASGLQLSVTDHAFARIDALLKHGDVWGAVDQYHRARRSNLVGHAPDLWYSQQMAWVTQALPGGDLQQLAHAETLDSSRIALENPGEDLVTAGYQRAILCASSGQQQEAEAVARRLSAEAPNWYQPHWILSRLLVGSGRLQEGQQEADLALTLTGDNKAGLRQQITSYQKILRTVLTARAQSAVTE